MSEEPANNEIAQKQEKTPKQENLGRIEWLDLTVGDAERIKNFYANVVGWVPEDVDMGSYSDFNMNLPQTGQTIAGVCHARGTNANLPAQWLVYVRVADVHQSAAECEKRQGKVLDGPRRMSGCNFCVIQDPSGAVMALMSD
ncbi:MAG: VOC family protein [Gammaproteobacteria bacterium]|nr:VOC family protein [Gammaproteobacteria bacterium]